MDNFNNYKTFIEAIDANEILKCDLSESDFHLKLLKYVHSYMSKYEISLSQDLLFFRQYVNTFMSNHVHEILNLTGIDLCMEAIDSQDLEFFCSDVSINIKKNNKTTPYFITYDEAITHFSNKIPELKSFLLFYFQDNEDELRTLYAVGLLNN